MADQLGVEYIGGAGIGSMLLLLDKNLKTVKFCK